MRDRYLARSSTGVADQRVERGLGRGDGAVDVGGGAGRDRRHHVLGDGVDDVDGLGGVRRGPGPVDVQLLERSHGRGHYAALSRPTTTGVAVPNRGLAGDHRRRRRRHRRRRASSSPGRRGARPYTAHRTHSIDDHDPGRPGDPRRHRRAPRRPHRRGDLHRVGGAERHRQRLRCRRRRRSTPSTTAHSTAACAGPAPAGARRPASNTTTSATFDASHEHGLGDRRPQALGGRVERPRRLVDDAEQRTRPIDTPRPSPADDDAAQLRERRRRRRGPSPTIAASSAMAASRGTRGGTRYVRRAVLRWAPRRSVRPD